MLGAAVGQAGVLHCAFEAEAGTEEYACPLPEAQGTLSFWNVMVHSA